MKSFKKALIFGAGTYGQVYSEYLKEEYQILGFLDNDPKKVNQKINGLNVYHEEILFEKSLFEGENIFVPIGNNTAREKIINRLLKSAKYLLPNYISKQSIVHDSCSIGNQVYILPGTIVMPFSEIQDNCIFSIGSNVSHHTRLQKNTFVSHGVNIGANVNVEKNCFFGIGSTVMTGVSKIGQNSVIGSGAVVIRDTPKNSKMVGNPARNLNLEN